MQLLLSLHTASNTTLRTSSPEAFDGRKVWWVQWIALGSARLVLYPFFYTISEYSSLCVLLCSAASSCAKPSPWRYWRTILFIELMALVDYHKKRQESEIPNHFDSHKSNCDLHSLASQQDQAEITAPPYRSLPGITPFLVSFLSSVFPNHFPLYLNHFLYLRPCLEVIFWGTRSEIVKAEMKEDKLTVKSSCFSEHAYFLDLY